MVYPAVLLCSNHLVILCAVAESQNWLGVCVCLPEAPARSSTKVEPYGSHLGQLLWSWKLKCRSWRQLGMLPGSGQALAGCPRIHRLPCSRYLQGSPKSRRLRAPQQDLWPRAIIGCHKICWTGTLHAWRGELLRDGQLLLWKEAHRYVGWFIGHWSKTSPNGK